MWSREEFEVIKQSVSSIYGAKGWDYDRDNGAMDFEGNVLLKTVRGAYRVMSWDYGEEYFRGSLLDCCKYITGEAAE